MLRYDLKATAQRGTFCPFKIDLYETRLRIAVLEYELIQCRGWHIEVVPEVTVVADTRCPAPRCCARSKHAVPT